ncbi:hypothetical protein V2W30_35155 [Streptomyces sp. Q6]|uniref:Uncharacterized protein n=1 Tax=Streptomyces citrinus TaxID=3118173 RepID=A0ACD5ALI4_9ACTN
MTRDGSVTVTGIGLVTPAGRDAPATWAAVRSGQATARRDPALRELPVSLSCRVDGVDELPRGGAAWRIWTRWPGWR